MSNINFLCKLTIVIHRVPCLFSKAKDVSPTTELVNSVTSDSVNLFNIVMSAFANEGFCIELVPCSDGWRRTGWKMIHMMPVLLVSSIPQCKWNHHQGACLESFQAIQYFEHTFIEAHLASNMSCIVRSLKSWIKTCSFLDEIITYSNEIFIDFESDIVVGSWTLGNSTRETVKSYVTVK